MNMQELIVIKAGIFDILGNFLNQRALEAFGAIILVMVGLFTKRYIVPLLKSQAARETAEHLLIIADDVTDYFAQKYPGAHWSIWLDRAIDKIIEITGVGRETATRAARAAVYRKDGETPDIPKPQPKLEGKS
jgi:hypothetical protein